MPRSCGSPSSCTPPASGRSSAWPRRWPTAAFATGDERPLPGQGGDRFGLARSRHRAYVGIVEWDGIEYEGSHEPLVERDTFDKVQELLAARAMRGTRERRHHHYLKGVLVCGVCGRRLSIQYSKGTYTYFYCLGQKDRRNGTGCRERYVAADHLEAEVEDLYGRIEVPTRLGRGTTPGDRRRSGHPSRGHDGRARAARHRSHEHAGVRALQAHGGVLRQRHRRHHAPTRAGAHRRRATGHRGPPSDARRQPRRLAGGDGPRPPVLDPLRHRLPPGRRPDAAAFNAAVLDEVHVRDGRVVEAAYKEPFDCSFLRRSSNTTMWWR